MRAVDAGGETSQNRRGRARPIVHKFGGAALADGASIRRAAEIVASRDGETRVVVVSALSGVTDALLGLAQGSTGGVPEEGLDQSLRALEARHLDAVFALPNGEWRDCSEAACFEQFEELARVLDAIRELGRDLPRDLARVLAFGERLSARLVAAQLRALGVQAGFVDGPSAVATSADHLNAAPDPVRTRALTRRVIEPLLVRGIVPVVAGFTGVAPDGSITTLGRGGSDLTATVLARALAARTVMFWKDVPGLLTADPRAVPDARLLPTVNLREAAELSVRGARVLHPRALAAAGQSVRVVVRPFGAPDERGTIITAVRRRSRTPVTAMAAELDGAIVSARDPGGSDVFTLAARAHGALAASDLRAVPVGMDRLDCEVSFLVRGPDSARAVAELRGAGVVDVVVRAGVATIDLVGLDIAGHAGVAARTLSALDDSGIPLLACGLECGRHSLTIAVDGTRAVEAQRAIHRAFQLHLSGGGRAEQPWHSDVVLLGAGNIGRALLEQVASASSSGRRAPIRICGVVDSTGFLFDARGLSRRILADLVRIKECGRSIVDHPRGRRGSAMDALTIAAGHALSNPVLVDATNHRSDPLLHRALELGWDLVLANKVPLATDQQAADRLADALRTHGRRMLYEATVGAGLPVIDTLRKLQDAGDSIRSIEGCPSGTLGYLFGEMGRGISFSQAVRTAMSLGYTEPDPRLDLSGTDVARKALILGRLLGFRGGVEQIAVESLVPESLRAVPRDEFLARLGEVDAQWSSRVQEAQSRGCVLRYRIRVTRRSIEVGIVAVTVSDSLSRLDGTDNQFTFTTQRYSEQPLVITGPGAGAAVTASGVHGDLLRLASSRAPRTDAERGSRPVASSGANGSTAGGAKGGGGGGGDATRSAPAARNGSGRSPLSGRDAISRSSLAGSNGDPEGRVSQVDRVEALR